MENIIKLRHLLHSQAELSNAEVNTNTILNEWVRSTHPDLLIEKIGGYGIAAVYKGKTKGKRILIRADIDALAIEEHNKIPYISTNVGVSHKCGHDGHAAILAGLALKLQQKRPEKGEVVLLFQAAEEIGAGAQAIIDDAQFELIKPNIAFALHNLPSFPKSQIIIKHGVFAAASLGIKIVFEGKTAHASQPETGVSPVLAIAKLTQELNQINDKIQQEKIYSLLTITHIVVGEQSFGIAPGKAECWLTLRSFDDNRLAQLTETCKSVANNIAKQYQLQCSFSIHEAFAATNNDDKAVCIVENAAKNCKLNLTTLEHSFKWSEDFGHFGNICPIALFGLGSGISQPALHNPNFDFPDDIIESGIRIFDEILKL